MAFVFGTVKAAVDAAVAFPICQAVAPDGFTVENVLKPDSKPYDRRVEVFVEAAGVKSSSLIVTVAV